MHACMYVCLYVPVCMYITLQECSYCDIFPVGVALLSCVCSRAKTVHLVLCLPNSEGEEPRSGLFGKREEPRSGYDTTK